MASPMPAQGELPSEAGQRIEDEDEFASSVENEAEEETERTGRTPQTFNQVQVVSDSEDVGDEGVLAHDSDQARLRIGRPFNPREGIPPSQARLRTGSERKSFQEKNEREQIAKSPSKTPRKPRGKRLSPQKLLLMMILMMIMLLRSFRRTTLRDQEASMRKATRKRIRADKRDGEQENYWKNE